MIKTQSPPCEPFQHSSFYMGMLLRSKSKRIEERLSPSLKVNMLHMAVVSLFLSKVLE